MNILDLPIRKNVLDTWKEDRRIKLAEQEERLQQENKYVNEFSLWLANSLPGDKFQYFIGPHIVGQPVVRVVQRAYDNGHIIMYQKRELDGKFSYWAKRKERFREQWQGAK